jgi:hypothetical protein
MDPKPRFIVLDDDGPVRRFYTKYEANQWVKARPELRVKVLPKEKQPNIFESTEEAVF